MKKYLFIDSQKETNHSTTSDTQPEESYPIWLLCKVLNVPESSYYDWNRTGRDRHTRRTETTEEMTVKIRKVHADSDSTYELPGFTPTHATVTWLYPSEGLPN